MERKQVFLYITYIEAQQWVLPFNFVAVAWAAPYNATQLLHIFVSLTTNRT